MRSHPGSYRLRFLLPADFRLTYGGPQPGRHGCAIRATSNLVEIDGRSREHVFDAGADLLRTLHVMVKPLSFSVSAILETPIGADSWSIIVGADVAFSPTSIDPYFPTAAA